MTRPLFLPPMRPVGTEAERSINRPSRVLMLREIGGGTSSTVMTISCLSCECWVQGRGGISQQVHTIQLWRSHLGKTYGRGSAERKPLVQIPKRDRNDGIDVKRAIGLNLTSI
jgi:hypothetical protein